MLKRTWGYSLIDLSTDNIRGLVQDPGVEDTQHIDRREFRIAGLVVGAYRLWR